MKYVQDISLTDDLKEAKGRILVLNSSIKDCSIHETFCDLIDANIDKEKGIINKRGDFGSLANKLEEYSQRYINCLYIMGALERDNHIIYDEETKEVLDMSNNSASPMAITCRASVSNLLGGDKAFNALIQKAKKFSMKIIIDSLTRVSSSKFHRKYRNILLQALDENGKANICFGSDGYSVSFDDTAMLNYRKIEAWNLLIDDIVNLATKYNIDGVHLDNCQTWPQIYEIDRDEMLRIDNDGELAYSALDILNGEIVIRNEESGYWSSDMIDSYNNPFLIKLTKETWKKVPNFIFIGECWGSEKLKNRHVILSKSGVIPRMYSLPRGLSSVFGRRIHRNGYIETSEPANVGILKEFLNEDNKLLPEGGVIIQSSSGQVWPYPALLYGRGNWSAIDLLFTLNYIPMTFMEEINGEAYRVQIANVYEQKELPKFVSSLSKSKSYALLEK